MGRLAAIAMLSAVMALCVCAEAACAKNARARQPAAHRSVPATGKAVLRKTPPVARAQSENEKSWMDRASVPSSSGGMGM